MNRYFHYKENTSVVKSYHLQVDTSAWQCPQRAYDFECMHKLCLHFK